MSGCWKHACLGKAANISGWHYMLFISFCTCLLGFVFQFSINQYLAVHAEEFQLIAKSNNGSLLLMLGSAQFNMFVLAFVFAGCLLFSSETFWMRLMLTALGVSFAFCLNLLDLTFTVAYHSFHHTGVLKQLYCEGGIFPKMYPAEKTMCHTMRANAVAVIVLYGAIVFTTLCGVGRVRQMLAEDTLFRDHYEGSWASRHENVFRIVNFLNFATVVGLAMSIGAGVYFTTDKVLAELVEGSLSAAPGSQILLGLSIGLGLSLGFRRSEFRFMACGSVAMCASVLQDFVWNIRQLHSSSAGDLCKSIDIKILFFDIKEHTHCGVLKVKLAGLGTIIVAQFLMAVLSLWYLPVKTNDQPGSYISSRSDDAPPVHPSRYPLQYGYMNQSLTAPATEGQSAYASERLLPEVAGDYPY